MCVNVYVRTDVCVCVYMCAHACTCMCMCVCMFVGVQVYMRVCIHVCMCLCTYDIYLCIDIYIYTSLFFKVFFADAKALEMADRSIRLFNHGLGLLWHIRPTCGWGKDGRRRQKESKA